MKKNSIKVGLIQQASSHKSGENLDKIIPETKKPTKNLNIKNIKKDLHIDRFYKRYS